MISHHHSTALQLLFSYSLAHTNNEPSQVESQLPSAGPKIGGVTLHIFAVIKLECAVIKSKLCSVKN